MSNSLLDESAPSSPNGAKSKVSQTDALLKTAIETAQPARLRNSLRDLCKTLPDARRVTAALLLATQQKYKRKIEKSKATNDENDDSQDADKDEEEGESERSADEDEYDTSDEEEDPGLSMDEEDDDTDDDVERSDPSSEEEDGSTDEEEHAEMTSTQRIHA